MALDASRLRTDFGSLLGSGAFGQVYRGTLDGRTAVAVKETSDSEGIVGEIRAHISLDHRNVVKFHGFVRLPDNRKRTFTGADGKSTTVVFPHGSVLLVMEQLDGGDLFKKIRLRPAPSFDQLKRWARHLAEGLAYMHGKGIVHGDIKLPNAMVHGDVAKLVDMGLATSRGADDVGLCGTLDHMAPELFGVSGRSPESDVWAFGVLMYTLFTERNPYHEHIAKIEHTKGSKRYALDSKHVKKALKAIVDEGLRPEIDNDLRAKGQYNADLSQLIKHCMQNDARNRPTAAELVTRIKAIGRADPMSTTHAAPVHRPVAAASPRPSTASPRPTVVPTPSVRFAGGGTDDDEPSHTWRMPAPDVNPWSGPMPWSDSARGIVRHPVTRELISVGGFAMPRAPFPGAFGGGTFIIPRYS